MNAVLGLVVVLVIIAIVAYGLWAWVVGPEHPTPVCLRDDQCPPQSRCVGGVCVPDDPDIPEFPPPVCVEDKQCPPGFRCRDGECVVAPPPPECVEDKQCQPGLRCHEGKCVGTPSPCAPQDGCPCAPLANPGAQMCYAPDRSSGSLVCRPCLEWSDAAEPCQRTCLRLSDNRTHTALPCAADAVPGSYKCIYRTTPAALAAARKTRFRRA